MASASNPWDDQQDDLTHSIFQQQPSSNPAAQTSSMQPSKQPLGQDTGTPGQYLGAAPSGTASDLYSSLFQQPPQSPPSGDQQPNFSKPELTTLQQRTPASGVDWSSYMGQPTIDQTPGQPVHSPTMTTQSQSPSTTSNDYATQVQQLSQISDPQQRAVAQDQLARSVYTDLQSAGHDVKWQGDQLIVDGRPYTVAGTQLASSTAAAGQYGPYQNDQTATTGTGVSGPGMPGEGGATTNPAPGQTSAGGFGSVNVPGNVEGVDAGKWADPNKHDPKYDILHDLAQYGSLDAALSTIQSQYPGTTEVSGDVIDVPGLGQIDIQRDSDHGGPFHWEPVDGGTNPNATTNAAPIAPGTPGAAGVPVNQNPSWMNAPTYTPGDINTNDIPSASYDQLMQQMGPDYSPTPVQGSNYQAPNIGAYDTGSYNFNGFQNLPDYNVGAVGDQEDSLMSSILANPESLDPKTVEMMKAKSREEQSALQGQEEDNLKGMGYDMGISDSNWLAAQRLQSQRDRDAAVVGKNRDIDIQAATQNASDRRAAAQLGESYVNSKGQLKLAQRGQVFSEQQAGEQNKQASAQSKLARAQYLTGVDSANAQSQLQAAQLRAQADTANNQNMFNAAKLRQDKVLNTVNTELQAAAATTNRLQLREQVKQAASDLGISQEKVMSQWLESLMQDATQRYGIDTSADIDKLKLNTSDKEFMEDLAFRYAQLSQQGDIAGMNYGLGVANLQEQANEFGTNSYLRSLGM